MRQHGCGTAWLRASPQAGASLASQTCLLPSYPVWSVLPFPALACLVHPTCSTPLWSSLYALLCSVPVKMSLMFHLQPRKCSLQFQSLCFWSLTGPSSCKVGFQIPTVQSLQKALVLIAHNGATLISCEAAAEDIAAWVWLGRESFSSIDSNSIPGAPL